MIFDYAVIGGGIIGLATAMTLGRRDPNARIILFEKEPEFAQHQSGRNSGVIHSGIYYKPGSLKAKLAREGNRSMVEFCREHGIKHAVCGKIIIATKEQELPLLEKLFERGLENKLSVTKLTPAQVQETEPYVRCLAGIRVPTTGIADYREVCGKYVEIIRKQGGTLMSGTMVTDSTEANGTHRIETTAGDFEARFLVNCGGLYSDRIARRAGFDPRARIIPFRGEYYEIVPERRYLVKTLIYPVPNPAFPFLGVHFTKMIDGSVHAGPNAVLALKREGYSKTDIKAIDLFETLTFPGFWKLAYKNLREGMRETYRSFNKAAFVRSLQQLIPEVTRDDLIPAKAGVRAQALMPDGNLVDDFLIVNGGNSLHVCNAPSPAATASLEIGKAIAERVSQLR